MKRVKVKAHKAYLCPAPQCSLEFTKANGRSAHLRGIHPEVYAEYMQLPKEERVRPHIQIPYPQEDVDKEATLDTATEFTSYLLSEGIKVLENNLKVTEQGITELRKLEEERDNILDHLKALKDTLVRIQKATSETEMERLHESIHHESLVAHSR